MRIATLFLLLAVASLSASSLAWLCADRTIEVEAIDGAALLRSFGGETPPEAEVDLGRLYADRAELLDGLLALPSWHRFPRNEALSVYALRCPSTPIDVKDPVLAKAAAWHDKTCASNVDVTSFIDAAPRMHPSGKSYALLAMALVGPSAIRDHARSFHVLELSGIEPSWLSADQRALAVLPVRAWEALFRGDNLALTDTSLVVAERSQVGLAHLQLYSRVKWASFLRSRSVALALRSNERLCARPATSSLCWQPLTNAELHERGLLAWRWGSVLAVLLAAASLANAYRMDRRRIQADRVHILRTLTHELRTPATSLRVDVDVLARSYDALPEECREPLLRLVDGSERLARILHRTARYLALFEGGSASRDRVKLVNIASVSDMLAEFAQEWPEGVSVTALSDDGSVRTDTTWLGVAVRNLVENAIHHGLPPVDVAWTLDARWFSVRVSDAGSTRDLSLAHATLPHDRGVQSTGLGLGLAITSRAVSLIGGTLSHSPSPTAFAIRIPRGRIS